MTHQSFEQRLAAAIDAYADLAPTEVDQVAMARLAVARSRRIGPVWLGNVPAGRGLTVVIALLALLVTLLVGAIAAGGYLRRDGPEGLRSGPGFVEPFIGLPPEGAAPSTPETGQLVLSVYGRMNITEDVHGIWVLADGRLIWRRSLDAHVNPESRHLGFGASEPTRAVIEQRLTPNGAELLRSEVIRAGLSGLDPDRECVGPVYWAQIAVRVGDHLMRGGWCDPELPGRLADFASWLPLSAWADQRIGGYVPSWYAVCLWSPTGVASGIEELLPRPTTDLLHSRGFLMAEADRPEYENARPESCYRVTTDDARAIGATLDEAGLQRDRLNLAYRIDDDRVPGRQGTLDFYPILPDGDTVEYGQ